MFAQSCLRNDVGMRATWKRFW